MEHLAGGSLQDRIEDDGPLPAEEAIGYTLQVADALRYAHSAGVFHKDIKPANILLTATGDAKLADFGIAAIREATASAAMAWSLAYAPPEVFGGDPDSTADPRDERSDLYSLAATLYTLVVGHDPFQHPTNNTLPGYMARILNNPVPPCGITNLESVLATAMAKEPGARYQTAGEFGQALKQALTTNSSITTNPPEQRRPDVDPIAQPPTRLKPDHPDQPTATMPDDQADTPTPGSQSPTEPMNTAIIEGPVPHDEHGSHDETDSQPTIDGEQLHPSSSEFSRSSLA